jgi:CheY-like chemotaxis protein
MEVGMASVARKQSGHPWVLVLDDDPIAARATARAVSSVTGARVALVFDVESALRLAMRASEPPAAAILDFELGGGTTGFLVLERLRASGFEAPCAFHTGAPGAAASALASGRLGGTYPVFDKGDKDGSLVSWVMGIVGAEASSHRSGTRRKVVPGAVTRAAAPDESRVGRYKGGSG